MIIIVKEINFDVMKLGKQLIAENILCDIIEEKDISVKLVDNEVRLYLRNQIELNVHKVLLIGKMDINLIGFLSYGNKYIGLNKFSSMLLFYTEFSAMLEIRKAFPKTPFKEVYYSSGEFSYSHINLPFERKVFYKDEVATETAWFRQKIEDKYGMSVFKTTVCKSKETYFPISIIPYLELKDLGLDEWLELIIEFYRR